MRAFGLLAFTCLIAVSSSQSVDQPISPVSPTCSTGVAGTIAINGNGKQEALADEAEVSLEIAVRNSTAEGARAVAGEFANDVITAVRAIPGIFSDNVTTTSVAVTPVTADSNISNGESVSTIIAYTFSNALSIKISNVSNDLLSQVLDTAVSRGGNNLTIDSVDFSLSDALSYNLTVKARRQAAQDARAAAEIYADALGLTLGPVLRITDRTYGATPLASRSYEATTALPSIDSASAVSTPISVGSSEVSSSISIIYTICNPPS